MKFRLYQHKQYYFNYLDLCLTVPTIIINKKYIDTVFDEIFFITNISFSTKLTLEISDIGWWFTFKVLGIGIKLNRQFSY